MKLQDQLDEITSNTRGLVQPERLATSERAIAELFASGIEDRILKVGARMPEFALPDPSGHLVRSSDLVALGPLILKFFRGRWCPYCVTELESWQQLYPEVRRHSGLLIAVSPETPRQNEFAIDQHKFSFPLLSDRGCKVAEQFGLAYTISAELQDYYHSILVNIPFINGEDSGRLLLPATYVIDREGKVVFASAYADFRVRPEPEEALAALVSAAQPRV